MTEPYLTDFDIQDFDWIDLKPDSWAKRHDRDMIDAYSKSGPSCTLWADETTVIACGGVACAAWKGFGEFWLIPSIYVPQYPKTVFKAARTFIIDAIEKMDLHRVQATIRATDLTAIGWIEHLGFEREGLMRKFGPNQEDQYLYARVK